MTSDNDSKEFVSVKKITVTMSVTPEQYSLVKKWSEMVPTLYMLDICVVGATKLNNSMLKRMERKAKLVNHLRNLDRENNGFSYLIKNITIASKGVSHEKCYELFYKLTHCVYFSSSLHNFFLPKLLKKGHCNRNISNILYLLLLSYRRFLARFAFLYICPFHS